jgi:hypothetical protein
MRVPGFKVLKYSVMCVPGTVCSVVRRGCGGRRMLGEGFSWSRGRAIWRRCERG